MLLAVDGGRCTERRKSADLQVCKVAGLELERQPIYIYIYIIRNFRLLNRPSHPDTRGLKPALPDLFSDEFRNRVP